ncbi:MAG: ferrochelatase [Gemmatales bacterium]|nr:ferrochelatase [Gemmatales bacterium]MDW7995759.1 ferrochelatase [Gemmatales bacterium]
MGRRSPIGVLLLQLGSPDDPSIRSVRRYLREFLSDQRVIELPRWKWYPILYGIVLIRRPAQSAAKYQLIWDREKGFPLKYYTQRQAEELQRKLGERFRVAYAMRYGNPAIASVVRDFVRDTIERMIVVPLYPQYSATTTASALDRLYGTLMGERWVPALRVVPPFFEHPAYIRAQTTIMRETLSKLSEVPEKWIFSFHGIPQRYADAGDPYPCHVECTVRALVECFSLHPGQYVVAYQSRFGREEWLRPYTDEVLRSLAREGVRSVFVITPGFVADCLETIDEIGREARDLFREAGGVELYRCPCLNDHPSWIEGLGSIILEEAAGWL